MLSTLDGHLLQKFSLHANQVRVMLELPQLIKPCICAELPMKKESSMKTRERSSLPSPPVRSDSFVYHKRITSVKVKEKEKMNMKLNAISHNKHPLFASVGDGLANWFGNGSETTQNLQFLTWTDDFV